MAVRRLLLAALVALTLGAADGNARADGDPAATTRAAALLEAGLMQYRLAHIPEALAAFEQGFLVKPDATFLFHIGQCHRMAGRPREAAFAYRRFLDEKPAAENRAEVEKLLAAAEEAAARAPAPGDVRVAATTPPPVRPADPPPVITVLPPPGSPASPTAPSPVAPPLVNVVEKTIHVPFYKKGPFWFAIVAIGVVVGGIVGFSVAATAPQDAPIPTMNSGVGTVRF